MPRKIPIETQREWLRMFESGMSESKIAKKAKAGLNTVKRNLELARVEKISQTVQVELYRNALQKHQDQLIDLVQSIDYAVEVPEIELHIPLGADTVTLEGGKVTYQAEQVKPVILDAESKPEYELLREHLRSDPLWPVLAAWKLSLATHVLDRVNLKERVTDVISTKTGFQISSIQISPPFVYENTAVDMFYNDSLRYALGTKETHDYNFQTHGDGKGQVTYGAGTGLAEVSPEQEANTIKQLLSAYKDIKKLPEIAKVAVSYNELGETTEKAKNTLQEILLLGIITGKCRICARLGIK